MTIVLVVITIWAIAHQSRKGSGFSGRVYLHLDLFSLSSHFYLQIWHFLRLQLLSSRSRP